MPSQTLRSIHVSRQGDLEGLSLVDTTISLVSSLSFEISYAALHFVAENETELMGSRHSSPAR